MIKFTGWGVLGTAVMAFKLLTPSYSSMASATAPGDFSKAQTIYDFSAKDIHGKEVSLEKYRGKVCIIVNVASQCGYTARNYEELGQLQKKYGESKDLQILAFPCNQFMGQEPGTNEEIVCFASERNAKFDFFDKIDVNGENAHPLWTFLKEKQGGTIANFIKWNFTKFVIDKKGIPVERFGPSTNPSEMEEALLKYF